MSDTIEQAKEAHAEAIQAHRLAKVGPELAESGLLLAATLTVLLGAVRAEAQREAFEAGWQASIWGQLDIHAPRQLAEAFAAYLAKERT